MAGVVTSVRLSGCPDHCVHPVRVPLPTGHDLRFGTSAATRRGSSRWPCRTATPSRPAGLVVSPLADHPLPPHGSDHALLSGPLAALLNSAHAFAARPLMPTPGAALLTLPGPPAPAPTSCFTSWQPRIEARTAVSGT